MTIDQADVERRVAKAKSLLFLDHPFFGAAVTRRPLIYTDKIPTACMSATGQMSLNPEFVDSLNVQQIMFLLAHEAMHFMLSHSLRKGHRDHHAWNIACDKVINDSLVDANVGEPIDGGVYMRDARNYAAEEVYDENDVGQPVGGIGSDVGDPVDGDGKQLDDSQKHQIEAQSKIETIQSAKAAKATGKLPSSIERMVNELVSVTTPWHQILERFMTAKIKDGTSWSRPNRRFMASGMYLPGTDYKPQMGTAVIAVDTSGSIGQPELDQFAGHVNRILDLCNPEKVVVIYCDAKVQHVDTLTGDDLPVRLKPHGGGGTAFKPVFDYVDDNDIDPEIIVYLTDGYGDQNSFDTTHDTVWLTTGSTAFNWGEVVEFKE
jgi:predicted metal-dependent peptidase